MKNAPNYSYKLRPGYGSIELLIELDANGEADELQLDLILLLEQHGFKLTEMKDPWQNQELHFIFHSDRGTIALSRDSWDLFFILGEENQAGILKIDQLLAENPLFQKINANFSDYK